MKVTLFLTLSVSVSADVSVCPLPWSLFNNSKHHHVIFTALCYAPKLKQV